MNKNKQYVEVAVKMHLDMYFTYAVPRHVKTDVKPGVRVIVPFHGRVIIGVVMKSFSSTEDYISKGVINKIKPFIDIVDKTPIFSDEMFRLIMWVSQYYMDSLPNVIKNTVSSRKSVNPLVLKVISPIDAAKPEKFFEELTHSDSLILLVLYKYGTMTMLRLMSFCEKPELKALKKIESMGLIKIHALKESSNTTSKKLYLMLAPNSKFNPKNLENAPNQLRIFNFINTAEKAVLRERVKEEVPKCDSSIRALLTKGVIVEAAEEELGDFDSLELVNKKFQKPILTPPQNTAWEKLEGILNQRKFAPVCVYGVTGSGKTELYCLAIEKLLEEKKGVLYLVPEISLTPQLLSILNERFKSSIAVIHSRMTPKRKKEDLDAIFSGKKKLVVGVRSAIFAPVKNLGVIIIDEEHEVSYKQDKSPRYNARDVGIMRGKIEDIPVILGSATPSVETTWNVKSGKYQSVVMRERVDESAMPFVELIDMRGLASSKDVTSEGDLDTAIEENESINTSEEKKEKSILFISDRLSDEIEKRLPLDEVSLLFLNQRGFSPIILCEKCGYSFECPNCSVSLTYHHSVQKALCHYCGYNVCVKEGCPACSGQFIEFHGHGTQKVEEEVRKRFPSARILRMDGDSMSGSGAYQEAFTKIKKNEVDVVVGTQMIAKGLHFPSITLVGVVNADMSLRFPDFRAAERTFQILTQVAGRSGRGENVGEVIIQTYTPEHYSIINAVKHDYDTFYEHEIALRREMKYPPFERMINIIVSGAERDGVYNVSNTLSECLKKSSRSNTFSLLGPTWASILKLRGRYRRQILMKGNLQKMRATLKGTIKSLEIKGIPGYIQISTDIDPLNLM